MKVAYCEFCSVSFEGEEAVAEVGCGAVEGCAGEVTHQGDGGAECPNDLALEGVEFGVVEQTELEGEELANEESSNDADSVSGTLFPISGGRPALPVPSSAAMHLSLLTSLVATTGPLVGPAQPTCKYPFPIPTGYGPSTKLH
jgi:hypothetical protein